MVFVCCFWGTNPERKEMCKMFVNKYPQVILLQNNSDIVCENTIHFNIPDEGYIHWKLINLFLKQYKKPFERLTLVDTDLILPKEIFESIENYPKIEEPHFLTYRKNFQYLDGKLFKGCNSKVYSYSLGHVEGHTGYLLSFNKAFLDKYTFCDKFIYGGYDYFLTNAILGKCMKGFEKEYLKVPKTKYDYIPYDVIHRYHGRDRNTPFEKYYTLL